MHEGVDFVQVQGCWARVGGGRSIVRKNRAEGRVGYWVTSAVVEGRVFSVASRRMVIATLGEAPFR